MNWGWGTPYMTCIPSPGSGTGSRYLALTTEIHSDFSHFVWYFRLRFVLSYTFPRSSLSTTDSFRFSGGLETPPMWFHILFNFDLVFCWHWHRKEVHPRPQTNKVRHFCAQGIPRGRKCSGSVAPPGEVVCCCIIAHPSPNECLVDNITRFLIMRGRFGWWSTGILEGSVLVFRWQFW